MKKKNKKSNFNPVAKNAHKFNKAVVFGDKKKDYKRKPKFKKRDEEL